MKKKKKQAINKKAIHRDKKTLVSIHLLILQVPRDEKTVLL